MNEPHANPRSCRVDRFIPHVLEGVRPSPRHTHPWIPSIRVANTDPSIVHVRILPRRSAVFVSPLACICIADRCHRRPPESINYGFPFFHHDLRRSSHLSLSLPFSRKGRLQPIEGNALRHTFTRGCSDTTRGQFLGRERIDMKRPVRDGRRTRPFVARVDPTGQRSGAEMHVYLPCAQHQDSMHVRLCFVAHLVVQVARLVHQEFSSVVSTPRILRAHPWDARNDRALRGITAIESKSSAVRRRFESLGTLAGGASESPQWGGFQTT